MTAVYLVYAQNPKMVGGIPMDVCETMEGALDLSHEYYRKDVDRGVDDGTVYNVRVFKLKR